MNLFRPVLFTVAACVFAVKSLDASAQATLTLPANVQEAIRKHPRTDPPPAPVRAIRFDISTGSKSEKTYERLENGLWGITERVPRRDGVAVGRAVAWHGLVELTSAMEVVSETTTAVPMGKGFLPFGLTTTSQTSLSRNTRSLSGDLHAVVKPEANARFSYVQAIDGLLTMSGTARTAKLNFESDVACSVGALADAKSLHADLQGAYLPVTCNGKDRSGPGSRRTLAYLTDSAIYVLLELTTDGRRESYRITGVEYTK